MPVPPLMAEYLTEWLEHRQGRLRPTTVRFYRSHIRVHLIPHLGPIRIDELRPAHLDAMYASIQARNAEIALARSSHDPAVRAGVADARTVGAATLRRIHATLRRALYDAVCARRLIETNPADHVIPPRAARRVRPPAVPGEVTRRAPARVDPSGSGPRPPLRAGS